MGWRGAEGLKAMGGVVTNVTFAGPLEKKAVLAVMVQEVPTDCLEPQASMGAMVFAGQTVLYIFYRCQWSEWSPRQHWGCNLTTCRKLSTVTLRPGPFFLFVETRVNE